MKFTQQKESAKTESIHYLPTLMLQTQDQAREIHQLTKQLGLVAKECQDLSAASSSAQPPPHPPPPPAEEEDPHRPRFSLPELKGILEERNSLKARVSDLEDELNVYKPNNKHRM